MNTSGSSCPADIIKWARLDTVLCVAYVAISATPPTSLMYYLIVFLVSRLICTFNAEIILSSGVHIILCG